MSDAQSVHETVDRLDPGPARRPAGLFDPKAGFPAPPGPGLRRMFAGAGSRSTNRPAYVSGPGEFTLRDAAGRVTASATATW